MALVKLYDNVLITGKTIMKFINRLWILTTGFWDDNGEWKDEKNWID